MPPYIWLLMGLSKHLLQLAPGHNKRFILCQHVRKMGLKDLMWDTPPGSIDTKGCIVFGVPLERTATIIGARATCSNDLAATAISLVCI